ncbi:MAG: hypothetical protein ACJAUD_001854 [Crocinitomicaceae bacterium]|jgi:hypothetical protein
MPRQLETASNEECHKSLGWTITVKGKAVNAKLGALLILKDGSHIWMDGMDFWPEGYYKGNNA